MCCNAWSNWIKSRIRILKCLKRFCSKIGLAFQITDDILDVTQIESILGKNKNSDSKNNKLTYIDIIGLDKAKESK